MENLKSDEQKKLEREIGKKIGDRMSTIQKEKDLTDQQVADLMGIPKQSFSNMKSTGSITLYKFLLFVSAINANPNELIYEKDDLKPLVPRLEEK